MLIFLQAKCKLIFMNLGLYSLACLTLFHLFVNFFFFFYLYLKPISGSHGHKWKYLISI